MIKLGLNIKLGTPKISNDIVYRIPVSSDQQDEFSPFNKIVDFNLSIRD